MSAVQILSHFLANPYKTHTSRKIAMSTMNCSHIAMVRDGNKLTLFASGTKKFRVDIQLKRDGSHVIKRKLFDGTNRNELDQIMRELYLKLSAPPSEYYRTPTGFYITANSIIKSDSNFQKAKSSRYFHQSFIGFCQRNGFSCGLR